MADLAMVRGHVEELRGLLNDASFGEQKGFLRSFVKAIDVWPEKVRPRYTVPVLSKGTPQETVGRLSIMANGTPGRTRTAAPGSGGQCSIR